MSQVTVPDIGDFKEVEVIEILVKPGDAVTKEQSLITLESDKATMEIPSPSDGVVQSMKVKVGDKVSKGTPILELDAKDAPRKETPKAEPAKPASKANGGTQTVSVPDIGDFKEVEVIEILVKPGDAVTKPEPGEPGRRGPRHARQRLLLRHGSRRSAGDRQPAADPAGREGDDLRGERFRASAALSSS